MKKCYVYLIKCKNYVKIGNAINPEKRVKHLQIGNPFPLELIAKLPFPTKKTAELYERELHHRLRKHRAFGEWFHEEGMMLALKEPRRRDRKVMKTDEWDLWQKQDRPIGDDEIVDLKIVAIAASRI